MENTQEFIRIKNIYQLIDAEDLNGSLATVLSLTNESSYIASKKADELMHRQGKDRSIGVTQGLLMSYDTYEVSKRVDKLVEEKLIEILNDYLSTINQDAKRSYYKVCSLIILLLGKELFGVIGEIKFSSTYKELIDSAFNKIFEIKAELVEELANHFTEENKPNHANRTREIGSTVFEMRSDKARVRYYQDLLDEDFSDDDQEVLLTLRDKFLSSTYTLNFKSLVTIVGPIAERTFRDQRVVIISELEQLVSVDSLEYLNKLIL